MNQSFSTSLDVVLKHMTNLPKIYKKIKFLKKLLQCTFCLLYATSEDQATQQFTVKIFLNQVVAITGWKRRAHMKSSVETSFPDFSSQPP